jgi:hypothetical protein
MKLTQVLLILLAVGIFIYIFKAKLSTPGASDKKTEEPVEDIQAGNILGKVKFKLLPFKTALEASREFIYNIAKAVMQKFSPAAKETLLTLGTRLLNAGVQYIHVVDVFKISLDKQRLRAKDTSKDKDKDKDKTKAHQK